MSASCMVHKSFIHTTRGCLCVLLAVVVVCGSTAAVAAEPVHTLNPEWVVGTPIIEGNTVSRYAIESTEVSRRQIEDMNAQDVTAALRRTPGVTIARFNPVGSFGGAAGGGIFIRGMGSSRPGGELATFIDGVNISNPIWGHPIMDIVPIDPAGSIRVHKAAQPNLFGNAFAAIDITPKRMTEEGFKTRLAAQYGTYNTFFQSAEHAGKIDRFDYYVGQSFKSSDGHRDHSSGQMESYYARLGGKLFDNWDLTWFGSYSDNFAHDPGVKGTPYNDGRYGTWNALNILTLSHEYDQASGYIKFHSNSGEADWDGESSFNMMGVYQGDLRTKMKWDTWGIKVREVLKPWDNTEITLGIDHDTFGGKQHIHTKYTNTDRYFPRHEFELTSAYISASHMFGSKESWYLTPSAGIRYYWHSVFDNEPSPHAGLILGYKDTELHFGYSRSVLYPALNVVILSELVSTPLVQSNPKGWKDLSAETMDHYEVGIRHTFNDHVTASLTAFWDEGKNRYRMFSANPTGRPPLGFDNLDSYDKHGFEAALTVTPTEEISLFAGAAYLYTDPRKMSFSPQWTVSAGMNWRFLESLQFSTDVLYRSEMYTASWGRGAEPVTDYKRVSDMFVANAKLSYFFAYDKLCLEESEVFVAVENLTDTKYEYSPGYEMPGTTFTVGFVLNF